MQPVIGISPPGRPRQRLHALDATRGVLAMVVVAHHASELSGLGPFTIASNLAVIGFFVMSGYVLMLSYDGDPIGFAIRRVVRLWPVYAVCLTAGYAVIGRLPPVLELLWWPGCFMGCETTVDLPAWTLFIEAWAVPLLPVMFRLAAISRTAALLGACGCLLLIVLVDVRLLPLEAFSLGIALTTFGFSLPQRLPAALLWLGRISYSLYLSHWVLLHSLKAAFGPWGVAAGLPLVLPLGWIVWRFVEAPSIRWSRALAHRAG